MIQPEVSIIIINYNTFDVTCKCITSIYSNTKEVALEIILVDNASTECDAGEFKKKFPEVTLIKSQVNLGFSKGNNLGVQHSKGHVILLLNSDTELTEDSVSICYKELQLNKEYGVITCKLVYPNQSIQNNCQAFPSVIKLILEKLRIHKLMGRNQTSKYFQGFYWDYSKPGFPDWVWGTFFMFKKEVLLHLTDKKLDEDFFMYVEDMQWCMQIHSAGFKILYTPATKVIHHGGLSGGNAQYNIRTNMNLFIKKNYNPIKYFILKQREKNFHS
ncbi:MAG: glycosyltransferase family 2 protein [Bacteroidetes bacterium]|nr:glycosyltransferase family 2 protein [Bacteroidota bacterium]